MTRYYKVTDNTGRTYTRSTASRAYTHAIIYHYGTSGAFAAWAGSLALAFKARRQYGGSSTVLPAIEITPEEYRVHKANP